MLADPLIRRPLCGFLVAELWLSTGLFCMAAMHNCIAALHNVVSVSQLRESNTVAIWPHTPTPTPKTTALRAGNGAAQILYGIHTPIPKTCALGLGMPNFSLDIPAYLWYNVFRMEKFVQFREVLTPSGVYVLSRLGMVVYVGKSLNLFARLSKHYTNLQRKRAGKPPYSNAAGPVIEFDDVMVKFCPVDDLDREEVVLIQKYLPQYNVQHNVVPRDLTHIPAFQELLRKARLKEGPAIARRPMGFALRSTRRPKVVTLPLVRLG